MANVPSIPIWDGQGWVYSDQGVDPTQMTDWYDSPRRVIQPAVPAPSPGPVQPLDADEDYTGGRPVFLPPSFDIGRFSPPSAGGGVNLGFDPSSKSITADGVSLLSRRDDFRGPTADTFQADPGYDFRAKEGMRAFTNAKSAQGLLRTGGTLKGLIDYGQGLASQEFGNVWNRAFATHQANLDADDRFFGNALRVADAQRATRAQNFDEALSGYRADFDFERDKFIRALTTHQTNAGDFDANFGNLMNLFALATRDLPTYQPTGS